VPQRVQGRDEIADRHRVIVPRTPTDEWINLFAKRLPPWRMSVASPYLLSLQPVRNVPSHTPIAAFMNAAVLLNPVPLHGK
jgi:hypothetical protein